MDKEYISKHGLMEAHKQFMKLVNEGYISASLTEAGDDEAQQGSEEQAPGLDTANHDNPNPTQPAIADGQEGAMQQQMPMEPQNGTDMAGTEIPPMDAGVPIEEPTETEPKEKDEVIDVDDLTRAQEKLNAKQNMVGKDLGELDGRIEKLMAAVEKMKGIIDHNNNEITDLKAELQKRVPTQTERLNMRSLDTYPYNVKPTDYWRQKESEGNYEAHDGEKKKKELVITNDDINNFSNSEIEKSFDEEMNQTMDKIFKGFA